MFWRPVMDKLPIIATFVVLYSLIVPCCLAFVLFRIRKDLFSLKIRRRYGVLFNFYRRNCFWWEIVSMARRAIFFISLEFVGSIDFTQTKQFLSISLLFFFVALQVLLRPLKLHIQNMLSILWDIICALLLISNIVIFNEGSLTLIEKSVWGWILTGILIFITIISIICIVLFKIRSFQQITISLDSDAIARLALSEQKLIHRMLFQFMISQHVPIEIDSAVGKEELGFFVYKKLHQGRIREEGNKIDGKMFKMSPSGKYITFYL